jgi:hypothetical protein
MIDEHNFVSILLPTTLLGLPANNTSAAGSKDKTLKIFTAREGGAEHVQADEPDAARQLVADRFVQRFEIQTDLSN